MKANIAAITLAVEDLERSLRFYREGLALASPGIIGTEFAGGDHEPGGAVAMFTLDNGLILSLYERVNLAKDAGIDYARTTGSPMSLGYFADSEEEVDRILARVEQSGGTIVRAPLVRPWGIYAGYFADPDGHLWEVVYFLPTAQ
ncbi:VOC family protein [Nocardia sp. NPDC020380]|uniref:VOC family protein n=1 Tax=Nocardia sp. NPDC020380 TaxID=3364309 RepID=UPI0037B2B661